MATNEFLISAPGKVILFGEHAVVYEKAAVAASVGLRTYLWFSTNLLPIIQLNLSDVGVDIALPLDQVPLLETDDSHPSTLEDRFRPLVQSLAPTGQAAALAFLYLFSLLALQYQRAHPDTHRLSGITVIMKSSIPVGAGLGSSASFSTCVAAALLTHFGLIDSTHSQDSLDLINHWTFRAEQMIHGQSSGVDNSITVFGGAKLYRKGVGMTHLAEFTSLRFLLVNTGIPKNTKNMVAGVAALRGQLPLVVDPLLAAIDGISLTFQHLLEAKHQISDSGSDSSPLPALGQNQRIAQLITLNQALLALLGVSHPTLDNLGLLAQRHGLASKLTGGGGGGCALIWIPDGTPPTTVDQLKSDLMEQNYTYYDTDIGCPGVQYLRAPKELNQARDILTTTSSFSGDENLILSSLAWANY
ncbi:Mevalonate kinase [Dimargaris cristalligena]|uniref:Mevalonate kinase n=1 Tax=Dimargaris cristalligena TaxID=215637 RepID=A0A4V1J4E2_9FUNG|nr:Mevalonate kinase [Dimargaris cristalligena]RKP35249.1 ribosomal protein S5 domain 2-type protein [Dimargaris cristalligena]|eukprot:RKP35249.1 ribosomal protein S5 domain 2-type protein [Dimargaris cristalligena]